MEPTLEHLAEKTIQGDQESLEALVSRIQDRIYGLALRMLWHPEDARDATQEILTRVVTHLGGFRAQSAFMTWAYRIASNYLLTARKSRIEEQRLTFDRFGEELEQGLTDTTPAQSPAETSLLLEEVKVGCTLGMLSCLDRPHRLAYVLGEILELDGIEGARVLEIRPATFRKRLSRAREAIAAFMQAKCGLVNPEQQCRCRRRVQRAVELGRVDPRRLLFAVDPESARDFPRVLREIRRLEEARRAAALYRSHPQLSAPRTLAREIRRLVTTQ
jgi:RNA polymerase sigma factor (sigma-70 family)